MEKLIYTYCWGGEPCSGTSHIPFEYKDKDQFIFDILNTYDKKFFKENDYANVLGEYLTEDDINNMEHAVSYFQDWFNKNKLKVIL